MCIVHYETPTSKVLLKAKHVATLQNIPYSQNSSLVVFLNSIVQNECELGKNLDLDCAQYFRFLFSKP
jgi:hypothetical protein